MGLGLGLQLRGVDRLGSWARGFKDSGGAGMGGGCVGGVLGLRVLRWLWAQCHHFLCPTPSARPSRRMLSNMRISLYYFSEFLAHHLD